MGFIKELCMNAESAAIYQIINNLHSKCIYKLKWPGLNKQEKGRETNHRPGILDNNRSCVQLCIRLAGIIFIGFSCFHTAQFCNQISSSSFHAPSAHLHLQFHDLKYGMNDSSCFSCEPAGKQTCKKLPVPWIRLQHPSKFMQASLRFCYLNFRK